MWYKEALIDRIKQVYQEIIIVIKVRDEKMEEFWTEMACDRVVL